MKVISLVIAFFVSGLLAYPNDFAEPKTIEFQRNVIHKYLYKGHVFTSVPHINQHKSGYHIDCQILLTKQQDGWVVMKLVNPELKQVNGVYSNFDKTIKSFPNLSDDEFTNELVKPVRFLLVNGIFGGLKTATDEPFWSVNIKKGIIDMLQVDLKPKRATYESENELIEEDLPSSHLIHYSTYEEGIKGLCETSYTRFRAPDSSNPNLYQEAAFFALNVTKVRNYRNCLTETKFLNHNFDKLECTTSQEHSDHQEFQDTHWPVFGDYRKVQENSRKPSPIEHYSTYKYNISYDSETPLIEGVINVGKIIVNNQGSDFVTETHQVLKFLDFETREIQMLSEQNTVTYNSLAYKIWDPEMDEKRFLDIPYLHLFFYPQQSRLVKVASSYLDKIAHDIAAGVIDEDKKVGFNIVKLVEIFAYLDTEHLYQVFSQNVINPTDSLGFIKRQVFVDIIGSSGTNYVALFVERLISENLVTNYEARQLVESLPQNLYYPAQETIEKYFELLQQLHQSDSSFDLIVPVAISWSKMVSSLCSNSTFNYREERLRQTRKNIDQYSDPRFNRNSFVKHSLNYHCSVEDIERYSRTVYQWLETDRKYNFKILWSQVLVSFGHPFALNLLQPHISGGSSEAFRRFLVPEAEQNDAKKWEEYNFFRTSLVYALHNIIEHHSKLLRSMSLPVFQNLAEPYELRLAAFTVFMASNPEPYEVESLAGTLRFEKNHQVISMVRSVLMNAANLTSPCHHKIARTARNVLYSLPASVDLNDEYYSQANWNEWYLNDKHIGVDFNWQYVANNMSQVPRAGHMNMGSSWGSYTSKWFTFAFQQKGFEKVWRSLLGRFNVASFGNENAFSFTGFVPRVEETARAKVFIKLFERTSLFILDSKSVYDVIKHLEERLVDVQKRLMTGKPFHLVKVMLPHSYQAIVSSDIGLPVHVHRSHPMVFALKIVNPNIEWDRSTTKSFNVSAHLTPFIWDQPISSVETINTGIRQAAGVYMIEKSMFSLPVQVSLGFLFRENLFTYSVVPKMGEPVFHHKVSVVGFVSRTQVDIEPDQSPLVSKENIRLLASPFIQKDFYGHPLIGFGLGIKGMYDMPEFGSNLLIWLGKLLAKDEKSFFADNLVYYLLEKRADISSYYHQVTGKLEQYSENPVQGIQGTFRYKWIYKDADNVYKNNVRDERNSEERLEPVREAIVSKQIKHDKARKIINHLRGGYHSPAMNDQHLEYGSNQAFNRGRVFEEVVGNMFGHYISESHFLDSVTNIMRNYYRSERNYPPVFAHNLAMTVATIGTRPTTIGKSFTLIHTLNYQTYWMKDDIFVHSLARPWSKWPQVWSGEGVFDYSSYPNELFWSPASEQNFAKKINVTIGWGHYYPTEKIHLHGNWEKVLDDMFFSRNSDFAVQQQNGMPWYEYQCQVDVSNGKQLSPACLKAIQADSRFNKLYLNIAYNNLPEEWINLAKFSEQFLQAIYFPWLNVSTEDFRMTPGNVKLIFEHSKRFPKTPLMNIRIAASDQVHYYDKIPAFMSDFPSVYPPFYGKIAKSFGKAKTCAVMKSAITTFDNYTYPVPADFPNCPVILAQDCSPSKRFSVILEPSSGQASIYDFRLNITLDDEKLLLKKDYTSDSSVKYMIFYDNQWVSTILDKPLLLHPVKGLKSVKIWKESNESGLDTYIVIECPEQHLRIVFDGKRIMKVQTNLDYIGKTCGLCGNSDHETELELEGLDRCVYERSDDFIESYYQCPSANELPRGFVKCPNRVNSWYWTESTRPKLTSHPVDAYPVIKKSMVIEKGVKKCFSAYLIPHCPDLFKPKSVEKRTVPFVCFDRADPLAIQYESEIGNSNLPFLFNQKTVTFVVDIPKKCVAKKM